jgi:transcriptional regulator with XRE-family HTH domain
LNEVEFQKYLSEKRKQKNLSQENVVVLSGTGISRQYYGMIEKSERRPSVEIAKEIARVLDIDWTIFFEIESNHKLLKRETNQC